MRGLALFVAGALVGGLAVHTAIAQNQSLSPNHGIVGLNHVGISVPDLDKAVAYYTKTMGFPEAFRQTDASGKVQLVYVQISQNTFVELQPANGRPTRHQPFRCARRKHEGRNGDVQSARRRRARDNGQRHQGDPVEYRRSQRQSHGIGRTPARVASQAGDAALAIISPMRHEGWICCTHEPRKREEQRCPRSVGEKGSF